MDEADARRILEVDSNATELLVQTAFKAKAQGAHPDHGGSDEAMSELVEARTVLLKANDPSLDVVRELSVQLERQSTREEARQVVERTTRLVLARTISPLEQRKNSLSKQSALVGGLTLITALFKLLAPELAGYAIGNVVGLAAVLLATATALLGLSVWLSREKIREIEELLSRVADSLSDPVRSLDLIQEIEGASDTDLPWTELDLDQSVATWIAEDEASVQSESFIELARRIGPEDFSRLFAAICMEQGTLRRKIVEEEDLVFAVYERAVPS